MANQKIEIINVQSHEDFHAFVSFPFRLYKGNSYWIPPIINEELNTLNPNINPVPDQLIFSFL